MIEAFSQLPMAYVASAALLFLITLNVCWQSCTSAGPREGISESSDTCTAALPR